MIILSGVLVVVAIALLIAGIVTGNSGTEVVGLDGLNLIYISIGVSIVSALFLAIGVFVRRKDLFGSPATAAGSTARTAKRGKRGKAGKSGATTTAMSGGTSVHTTGSHTSGSDSDTAELAAMVPPPGEVPATAVVYVVRGRRRYHIDSCRQLAGRSKEELTFAEAREEGFSPCTACMPDTALAARAVAGGLTTTDEPDAEAAEDIESAAQSEDERGAVGRDRRSGAGANGALGPVTPVQRQALEDLGEDEDEPAMEPIGPAGEGTDDATEPAASDSGADAQHAEQAEQAEPAATPEPRAEDTPADDEAAEEPAADTSKSADEPAAQDDGPAAQDDGPDQRDDAAAAEVPPQATHPAPAEPSARSDAASKAGGEQTSPDDGSLVRILSGTKRYHRPDCALIEDIGDDADDLESLSRAEAQARGCTPCLVCQPDKEPATRD